MTPEQIMMRKEEMQFGCRACLYSRFDRNKKKWKCIQEVKQYPRLGMGECQHWESKR